MRLLVPLDLSSATERVLATAIKLSRAMRADVFLLHVAAPEPDFVGYGAGSPALRDQIAHEHREEHRQLQAHAQALRDLGVDCTALLIQGPTADAILKEAQRLEADLGAGGDGAGALRVWVAPGDALVRASNWVAVLLRGRSRWPKGPT